MSQSSCLLHSLESLHFNTVDFLLLLNQENSLKGDVACLEQTAKSCVKLCIFMPRIPFQTLSGFKRILVGHVGANLLQGATCFFPVALTQNNHTETVLIKSLLVPLVLSSY